MRNLAPIIAALIATGCTSPASAPASAPEAAPAPVVDASAELAQLYDDDQLDRQGTIDWDVVGPRDRARRARVDAIVAAGGAVSSDDFHHAAMVFQHGDTLADFERAHELAMTAASLDPANLRARWLAAASLDRALMNQGKPQLYGTQSRTVNGGVWELYEVDPSITDEERARWNVPPIAEARARVASKNAAAAR